VPASLTFPRSVFALLAASIALVSLAPPAWAAPGSLDPSFGGNGKVTTNFGPELDEGNDVAIQPDGKIVVVGMAAGRFAVARYGTAGSLDDSFSGNGKVQTNFPGGTDRALGVAIQPNGKIVVAGIHGVGADGTFALVRYTSDGNLDPAFGGDGTVKTNITPAIDGAHDLALQADGKIVAAGFAGSVPLAHTGTFALARYRPNGRLDTSFGGDGVVRTDFTDDFDGAMGVAIQANGKIVTAGSAGGINPAFALARYRPDGTLDDSFGGDGKVRTNFSPFGAEDVAQDLAVQANGRIVAAGLAREPDFSFALARYRRDGTLDESFGGDGKVRTGFSSPHLDQANDVAIQADGKIVAAGFADGENPPGGAFALVRYAIDGTLDDSFGGDGKVRTNFTGRFDGAAGVAIQVDGRIVAAGVADDTDVRGADPTFALARYLAV
jgi:uncharacterized delta-60 repeat protein